MYVDPGQAEAFRAQLDGSYEQALYEWLDQRDVDLDSSTVWDIGAHFGYHSLVLSNLVGESGRVLAFEPNPDVHSILKDNLERNSGLPSELRTIPLALGGTTEDRRLMTSGSSSGASSSGGFLEEVVPPLDEDAYRGFGGRMITVMSGDHFVAQSEEEPPDLLKIDVEGAEAHVLEGCSGILESRSPCVIVEVHTITAMYAVMTRLGAFGYEMEQIDSVGPHGPVHLGCLMSR